MRKLICKIFGHRTELEVVTLTRHVIRCRICGAFETVFVRPAYEDPELERKRALWEQDHLPYGT